MMEIEALMGKTLRSVEVVEKERILFTTTEDEVFVMEHSQDCCETVEIEDINGDLDDLVNNPILVAVEVSQEDPNASESGTWTFYKLATVNGWVDIRWYGASNGYYSESVNVYKRRDDD
jgi:hypothetical protein